MASAEPTKRLVSIKEVCRLTSLSRTSIFLKCRDGRFPKPVVLGEGGMRKAFVLSEIEAWVDRQIEARDKVAA